ncbi:MAG: 3-deoxy-D-manno-octulosonic acid transferase [Phycisphaerae bacterium]|nr:3-deoxy-D-manno-octulosonic acid transferase [Phycisphaerae bacterium]
MKYILNVLYFLVILLVSPILIYRMIRQNRYRQGWSNRFGFVERKNADKKCVWIHAVSVGEVNATGTIVKEFENQLADYEILISTTTDTGFARANALYANKHNITFFPLDFSFCMQRAFKRIRPVCCLLMELEVWPNFCHTAAKENIPIVIVNGRISDRSYHRYKKIKFFISKIFKNITLILCQTNAYAKRFAEIGCSAEKIVVTGSLKYDTAQITDKVEGADELKNRLGLTDQKVWIAGGTGNDEEKIILGVFKELKTDPAFEKLLLAVVPRKPERFNEVAKLITENGFDLIRYSEIKGDPWKPSPALSPNIIILGDTMGDLRKFYCLADIIFVGRSLVPMGGSDMAEAAALGRCTTFGPYATNFRHTVNVLLQGDGAVQVQDGEELLATMKKLLSDTILAEKIAQNGQNVIRANQGATQRTIEQIKNLIAG